MGPNDEQVVLEAGVSGNYREIENTSQVRQLIIDTIYGDCTTYTVLI